MSERIHPLRRRMIEDMTIRDLPATRRSYIHAVKRYSLYFGRSPDLPGLEDVRTYQVHLAPRASPGQPCHPFHAAAVTDPARLPIRSARI